MMSIRPRSLSFALLLAGVAALASCGARPDDDGPIDVAAWVKANKPVVEALRPRFDAAAALVKDLPATSVHNADPAVPLLPITNQWGDGENAVMVAGVHVRGLPEFGRDDGKSLDKGETGISVAYTGYVDLASAYSMVDAGDSHFVHSTQEGVGLTKKLAKIRFAIIGREVSYRPGTIDVGNKTFKPGSYEGVAHVVDLDGPKHLGSVSFSASNTGSFESYAGSEGFMLRADLAKVAIRALHAEMAKVFPAIRMPALPK